MRNHQRTQPFEPLKCKLHGNFVSMLCANCQELICVNCLVEQHRGHQIQQLVESFEIVQQEMNTALQRMNEKLGVVGRLDEVVSQQLAGVNDSCAKVQEAVQENFQVLMDQLKAKQTQIEGGLKEFQESATKDLVDKQQIIQQFGQKLILQRKNLMKQLESTLGVDQFASNEQLYLQKLAAFVQNFIDNQDAINELQSENQQLNTVMADLNKELEIPRQFCLDFSSVQKFVENIEGLYMCMQKLGDE